MTTTVGHDAELLAERVLDVVPRLMVGIRRSMREAASPGLTIPQFRVLRFVSREPGIGVSGLAERLGMSVTATSALVDRIVRAGELARIQDTEERRRVRLTVTPAGEARIERAQAHTRAWLAEEIADLPARERARLDAALDVLARLAPVDAS
jgi:DNA-binding MarR family transcriptional regulator